MNKCVFLIFSFMLTSLVHQFWKTWFHIKAKAYHFHNWFCPRSVNSLNFHVTQFYSIFFPLEQSILKFSSLSPLKRHVKYSKYNISHVFGILHIMFCLLFVFHYFIYSSMNICHFTRLRVLGLWELLLFLFWGFPIRPGTKLLHNKA